MPGSAPILIQRGRWALKNLHVEFASTVAKLGTSQTPALASAADSTLSSQWTSRTRRKLTRELSQSKLGKSFNIHTSQKCLSYTGPVAWRWMPQHCRRTLGDCLGSQPSLPFPQLWKLLALHFLFSQGTFILLRALMGRKTRQLQSHSELKLFRM